VPPLLEQALVEVGDEVPLHASIERDLVWCLANAGSITQLLSHARAALRDAEASGQRVLVAEALDHLCMAEFVATHDVDPALLERAVTVAEQVGSAPALEHPGVATGRLSQAVLERAVDEHERLPQPFERARTLLALGTVQRRARHQRAARETLEEAARCFDALGAPTWATKARTELGRIGGRATTRLVLTATEQQVANLVADGLTNREVATSLFFSAKTVETNLTRIYRKLGVSSRRELARRMRGGNNDGAG
jgi:DNA-binding CsgD family transcriptional regulator